MTTPTTIISIATTPIIKWNRVSAVVPYCIAGVQTGTATIEGRKALQPEHDPMVLNEGSSQQRMNLSSQCARWVCAKSCAELYFISSAH